MFSVIFPGQGSQIVGMGKEFYDKFELVKSLFKEADETLNYSISKLILEGPKEELDLTANTQPAIFLISYSIFNVIKKEFNIDLNKAKYFAGHSLGEFSALCCADTINFKQTINLLNHRGKAMQEAVPKGEGGMYAVLGTDISKINKIINDISNELECYIANDNSNGQVVVSGKIRSLIVFGEELKKQNIKFIQIPVSAPFHSPLMKNATEKMRKIILDTDFNDPVVSIISNVTASPQNNSEDIRHLLIKQIENPVRWRETINIMIKNEVTNFVEIGPGKVLSGLIKRIDRNVRLKQVNNLSDLKNILND